MEHNEPESGRRRPPSDDSSKRVTVERRKFMLNFLAKNRRLYVLLQRNQRIEFYEGKLEADPLTKVPLSTKHRLSDFSGTAYASIIEDVRMFNQLGIQIHLIDDPGSSFRVLVDATGTDSDTARYRELLRSKEKSALAAVALGIILGVPSMSQRDLTRQKKARQHLSQQLEATSVDDVSPEENLDYYNFYRYNRYNEILRQSEKVTDYMSRVGGPDSQVPPTTSVIRDALFTWNKAGASLKAKEVYAKLERFWREMHRSVAIDAGTTNDVLANRLHNLELPMEMGCLARLSVCTNSRKIFMSLGVADVLIKTIIVGGEQLARTEAIAGRMAEAFLKDNSLLRFGISILGAGAIDTKNMVAYVDHEQIANMKVGFLEKSNIRILVVDNGKLRHLPSSANYPFVKIDPEYIDLVVTNVPLSPAELETKGEYALREHRSEEFEFAETLRNINRAVPVLVAKYGDPNEPCLVHPDGTTFD